jgi:hypothetical protein
VLLDSLQSRGKYRSGRYCSAQKTNPGRLRGIPVQGTSSSLLAVVKE